GWLRRAAVCRRRGARHLERPAQAGRNAGGFFRISAGDRNRQRRCGGDVVARQRPGCRILASLRRRSLSSRRVSPGERRIGRGRDRGALCAIPKACARAEPVGRRVALLAAARAGHQRLHTRSDLPVSMADALLDHCAEHFRHAPGARRDRRQRHPAVWLRAARTDNDGAHIELLFQSLTMRMAFVGAFATVLLLGLLIPCLNLIAAAGRWRLPGAAALVSAGCLIAGASMSGFNRDNPRTNSIYYGLDTDTGKAAWFSLDLQEDDWTAHYLGANPQRSTLSPFVPFMHWQSLIHEAPAVALAAPLIERLDGAPDTLHLRVSSPRQAPRMYLYGDERNPVLEATVDGTPIDAAKAYAGLKPGQKAYAFRMQRWGLCYFNVPKQGIELRMRLRDPAAGYRMEVVDQSYGIAGLPGVAPRPDSMIPFPLMMDSVWVRKQYTF